MGTLEDLWEGFANDFVKALFCFSHFVCASCSPQYPSLRCVILVVALPHPPTHARAYVPVCVFVYVSMYYVCLRCSGFQDFKSFCCEVGSTSETGSQDVIGFVVCVLCGFIALLFYVFVCWESVRFLSIMYANALRSRFHIEIIRESRGNDAKIGTACFGGLQSTSFVCLCFCV